MLSRSTYALNERSTKPKLQNTQNGSSLKSRNNSLNYYGGLKKNPAGFLHRALLMHHRSAFQMNHKGQTYLKKVLKKIRVGESTTSVMLLKDPGQDRKCF